MADSYASAGSGSSRSSAGSAKAFRMPRCRNCNGQAEYCERCKKRFEEHVQEDLCAELAFGNDRNDFDRMRHDLETLVDEETAANQSAETHPGSTQTPHQRRKTRKRALRGMEHRIIYESIEQHRRDGRDVPGGELEVLSPSTKAWLADIDDGTQSWLHAHHQRIAGHATWLVSNAVDREISRADSTIGDGESSIKTLAGSQPHEPRRRAPEKRGIDPGLAALRRRVEARAREYVRAERWVKMD